jgi:hypothetical protein
MDTQSFLEALRPHAEWALVFQMEGRRVAPGYHVTEVKAVTVQAMDCGGRGSAWNETVIQLWAPRTGPDETHMPVRKFLGIYERVAKSVPVDGAALLRVEYGDVGAPAIQYLVAGVEAEGNTLVVRLTAPGVACKPATLGVGAIPLAVSGTAQGCC